MKEKMQSLPSTYILSTIKPKMLIKRFMTLIIIMPIKKPNGTVDVILAVNCLLADHHNVEEVEV